MTCRELIEFLIDYTDGELPPAVKSEFERHLKLCPSCVAYLDSYRKTVTLAKECLCREGDEAIPATVPSGLVQAIIEARKKQAAG